jgi:hypothetical protein
MLEKSGLSAGGLTCGWQLTITIILFWSVKKGPQTGMDSLEKWPKPRNVDMRFGTWNIWSLQGRLSQFQDKYKNQTKDKLRGF